MPVARTLSACYHTVVPEGLIYYKNTHTTAAWKTSIARSRSPSIHYTLESHCQTKCPPRYPSSTWEPQVCIVLYSTLERCDVSSRADSSHCPAHAGYVGGSGLQAILAHPKAHSFDITALVRSEAKAKAIENALGIKTVIGSLQDHALLTERAEQADVVLQQVGICRLVALCTSY